MYAYTYKTGAGFFVGVCEWERRHLIFATLPPTILSRHTDASQLRGTGKTDH
jgi:hypothetical protein